MAKFLLGPGGRLVLSGGRPLLAVAGQLPTASITLVPGYLGTTSAKFNVQTTAASGDTTADVPVLFTYAGGAPSTVQARAIDANGAAIPGADWIDLQTVSVDPTAKTGVGYLPGVRAGTGYRREIRTGAFSHRDANVFSVGPTILPWGQSNMVNHLKGDGFANVPGSVPLTDEGAYFRASANTFAGTNGFVSFPGGGGTGSYDIGSAGGLAMLRNIGTRLKAKFGREVGLCMCPIAIYSTPISAFITQGGSGNLMLTNSGTTAGNIGMQSPLNFFKGDYQVVAWQQGETESQALTVAQRLADLKTFCQMHINQVAKFGRPANKLTFLFASMGTFGDAANIKQAEVLRQAVLALIADPDVKAAGWDVRLGWSCIDLDVGSDSLHLTPAAARVGNRRLTQAFEHALDPIGTPYGARGPMLTGAASRSGDDITLTVEHEGGTALIAKAPGSPITGWYANTVADFSGTDVPLTNVTIVSPTQIRVTATGAPTTFWIKHCGHKLYTALSYHPDVSTLIYDNFAYPTGANAAEQFIGLPLQYSDSIKVAP